ncbi:uncharacterized protein EAE98_009109 [Botrytis deweyae]|uniref:Uncharacterized protein n=1 Tax=Botrytis deweyae TaxID=2478750 RepID=A0ABQ7ICG1_9HELO|nr:uncharacterized protein EAE98_009109 [Botrytis deweyae]KAF7919875.1 hypothetical protein EAE98_009109 [Botrytis deweyae]
MSTSSSKTSININLNHLEGNCLRDPKLQDPAEAIITARFNHGFDPDLPILPLCMHSKDRDVNKTPTELSRDDTNKGSSFHSEGREWNKDGEVSWAVLSGWYPACKKEYEKDFHEGYPRKFYITAMLRRHWIMVGEENKTPRGREEAMEVIRQAGSRFDSEYCDEVQYCDEVRIYNIAQNESLHMNKLERALGEHITANNETMVRTQGRLGAFILEQQSKIDSDQAYESAYASSRDPENRLMYGPANYPACNPPSTPTSVSADKCPSTYPGERHSQPSSLHGSQSSHKSAHGESGEARSSKSGEAHNKPMRAQSASEISRRHSSERARPQVEPDIENFRAPCTKGSTRSFSPSNF